MNPCGGKEEAWLASRPSDYVAEQVHWLVQRIERLLGEIELLNNIRRIEIHTVLVWDAARGLKEHKERFASGMGESGTECKSKRECRDKWVRKVL